MNALVLGGGIAGLAHALRLKKRGFSITLLEESPRAGGVIRTEKIDGYMVEYGPNTVLPTSELMELIYDAGLEKHLQLADAKSPRYVLFEKKLHRVPMGPFGFLTSSLLSFSGKRRLLQELFVPARHETSEETLYEFSSRRLGTEATERLLKPFISGVWAGDAHELSARAAFPNLFNWEKEHGGVIKGLFRSKKIRPPNLPKGLLSFDYGLQALPQALAAILDPDVRLGEKVVRIERNNTTNQWVVGTELGIHTADRLVSSLPAYRMAELTGDWAPSLSEALASIPYAPVSVAHFSVKTRRVGHSLNGFGYLAAPSENAPLLGCLFSSSLFSGRAPKGESILTVFIKGAANEQGIEAAKKSMIETLDITGDVETLGSRLYRKAIPQYTLGHHEKLAVIDKAEKEWPGLFFIGNYLEGISVGDVVRYSVQKAV